MTIDKATTSACNETKQQATGSSDCIYRKDALDALGEEPLVWYDGEDEIAERNQWRRDKAAIESLPSAEPRKKGKWIGKEKYMNSPDYFSWQCSVCGCVLEDPTLDKPYPFCPNCGADMREGEEE